MNKVLLLRGFQYGLYHIINNVLSLGCFAQYARNDAHIEKELSESSIQSLRSHQPQLLHFGISDETAFEVGLVCGGEIRVFIKSIDPDFSLLSREIKAYHTLTMLTAMSAPDMLLGKEILVTEGGKIFGQFGTGLDGMVETF